jgi:hypothetical protein
LHLLYEKQCFVKAVEAVQGIVLGWLLLLRSEELFEEHSPACLRVCGLGCFEQVEKV